MTAATLPPNPRRASRLLADPTGDLVLRVLGAEHEGREIRIRSPKCTIGSARGCTLRLTAAGVRPLHCWILRGPGGTIVRRRDPRTRLNGRRFGDAPLAPGDRLQIGSVELEVSECPRVPVEWTIQNTDLPAHPPVDAWMNDSVEQSAKESAQQAEQLRTLEEKSARERSELAERLAKAEVEFAQQRAQLTDRLRTMQSEAFSERDSLVLEKERMQLSLATSEQELAELRNHLSSRESEIEAMLHAESERVASMQVRLEQVARDRTQLEDQLQEQTEALYGDVLAREAERDRLKDQCQRLELQAAQLRELVGYTAAERDNLSLRLDSREQNSFDQQRKIAAEKEELQRRLDATVAKFAGTGVARALPSGNDPTTRQAGSEQASAVQQLLEELLLEKGELEAHIAEKTASWQRERESLRQQTERVSEHCKQVDGQLSNVRGLLETLVTERDAIGQQLAAADARLGTEQQQWLEQRAALERQIQGYASSAADGQRQMAELAARLEAENSRAAQWQQRAEENAQKLAAAGQQLAEAAEKFAALRAESDARLQCESARAEQMAIEAKDAREQLATTQVALADTETHLSVMRTESGSRLQIEQERTVEAQLRCEELTKELATTDLRLTEAERKLAAYRIAGDERVNDTLKRSSEWEGLLKTADEQLVALRQQLGASEARCNTLQVELNAQQAAHQQSKEAAAVRWALLEQQTSSLLEQLEGRQGNVTQPLPILDGQSQAELNRAAEAERIAAEQLAQLDEECRTLRERLAEKDRELAGLAEQLSRAGDVRSTSSATVPYAELQQTLAAEDPPADDGGEAWSVERAQLQQRIAELEQQLGQSECSQNVTLGADAIANLQSNSESGQASKEAADLRAQLGALQSELAAASDWRERYQTAEVTAEEQRQQVQRLTSEVESLQRQLSEAASASPAQTVTLVAPLAEPAEGDQLAQLQSLHEHQPPGIAEERRALAEDRALLETARQELAAQREELLRTQREAEVQLRERENDLRSKEETLASQAEELADRLERAAAQEAELESQHAQPAAAGSTPDKPPSSEPASEGRLTGPFPSELTPPERPAETSSNTRPPPPAVDAQFVQPPSATNEPVSDAPPASVRESSSASVRESSSLRRSGSRPKPVWTQPDCPPPPADESIETYMARLLQRVSVDTPAGESKADSSPPPPATDAATSAESEQTKTGFTEPASAEPQLVKQEPTAPSATEAPAPDASAAVAESQELASQGQPPESPTNMEAMRAVANTVARRAIVRHRREVGNRLAVAQAIGAGMTLVATIAAGWCAYRAQSFFGGIGAMIGFVAACFWFGKALGHALKALILDVPEADAIDVAEQSAEVESGDSEPIIATGDDGHSAGHSLPSVEVENDRSGYSSAEVSATTEAKRTSVDPVPTKP